MNAYVHRREADRVLKNVQAAIRGEGEVDGARYQRELLGSFPVLTAKDVSKLRVDLGFNFIDGDKVDFIAYPEADAAAIRQLHEHLFRR